jgi:hypothetical protein
MMPFEPDMSKNKPMGKFKHSLASIIFNNKIQQKIIVNRTNIYRVVIKAANKKQSACVGTI